MRPNIVFAFADDWGRYASAYRNQPGESSIHELIETPNFDRIANEGTLFLNANVPAPSCTPCRSSILTGRYFWQTGLGAILQGARWDETIPTYPLMLEEAGYHIGYTYKVWSPGLTTNAPYGGARTAYESAGTRYNSFSEEVTARPEGQSVDDSKKEILDETAANFDSFLDARDGDEPFCYWWGPTNTHRVWQQGSGKKLWDIEPDDLKGRMPEFLPDVHEIREDFADYLGECQAVDAGLGVLLAKLEEIGELDNTIIAVSGDHGIPGFPRAKCNLYKLGTEVSMAVRWPEAVTAGRTVDDFVNLMDIAPTFLEIAKTKHPGTQYQGKAIHPIKGKSMIAMLKGKNKTVHSEDNIMGWELFNRKAIRKGTWKIIWIEKPHGNDRWALYNLKNDPLEQDDLAEKNTQKLKEMISLWETYKKENGVIIDEDLNLGYSGSNSHFNY